MIKDFSQEFSAPRTLIAKRTADSVCGVVRCPNAALYTVAIASWKPKELKKSPKTGV
jgi:hypothetical protein